VAPVQLVTRGLTAVRESKALQVQPVHPGLLALWAPPARREFQVDGGALAQQVPREVQAAVARLVRRVLTEAREQLVTLDPVGRRARLDHRELLALSAVREDREDRDLMVPRVQLERPERMVKQVLLVSQGRLETLGPPDHLVCRALRVW